MSGRLQPHILLFLVNLIYAGNYTIAKFAMPEFVSPGAFVVMRAVIGAVVFFLIHALWIRERVTRRDLVKLALCGAFGVAINQLMFFKGLSLTHPINAALIMITVPILVLIVASIGLSERVTAFKVLGIASGLGGAAMIIMSGSSLSAVHISRGDLFIFINATSYAIYLVLVKSLMDRYEALTVMRWVFLFGMIIVLPFGVTDIGSIDWGNLPWLAWMSIIYVLVAVTILTYLFNAVALKAASATLVSTYIYLQPLLAAFIAISLGKDTLNREKIIAAFLIFFGLYLVSLKVRVAAK